MSDVKSVHIHLQLEVPEVLDLAQLTRDLHDWVKTRAAGAEVVRLGIKNINMEKHEPTENNRP